jgi:hypothetical protein
MNKVEARKAFSDIKQEITELENKAEKLRHELALTANVIAERRTVAKYFAELAGVETPNSQAPDSHELGNLTLSGACARLISPGTTLKLSKIADLLLGSGYPYPSTRTQLASTLSTVLGRDRRFKRVRSGLFTRIEPSGSAPAED